MTKWKWSFKKILMDWGIATDKPKKKKIKLSASVYRPGQPPKEIIWM